MLRYGVLNQYLFLRVHRCGCVAGRIAPRHLGSPHVSYVYVFYVSYVYVSYVPYGERIIFFSIVLIF